MYLDILGGAGMRTLRTPLDCALQKYSQNNVIGVLQ